MVCLLVGLGGGMAAADEASLAKKIIGLCNRVRQENGVRPVAQLNYLGDAAGGHSKEMLQLKYFSHTSPTAGRERPKSRIELAGGWDLTVGENLFRAAGYSEDEIAQEAVDAWMASPVHRANLLNPRYNSMGLGITRVGTDEWIITQAFSLQAVSVQSCQFSPTSDGYDVNLQGQVVDGTAEGGVLVSDKIVNKWSGGIQSQFHSGEKEAKVGIGQKGADGQYSVEVEFPMGAKITTPVRTEIPAIPKGK